MRSRTGSPAAANIWSGLTLVGPVIVETGVEMIEIRRIERAQAEGGQRFERRVFGPQQIETCSSAGRWVLDLAIHVALSSPMNGAASRSRTRVLAVAMLRFCGS